MQSGWERHYDGDQKTQFDIQNLARAVPAFDICWDTGHMQYRHGHHLRRHRDDLGNAVRCFSS
jgi:hypothetical protein